MTSCPFCGLEYNEEESVSACRQCPMSGGCDMLRCPRCGYEVPRRSRLLAAIESIGRKFNGVRRSR